MYAPGRPFSSYGSVRHGGTPPATPVCDRSAVPPHPPVLAARKGRLEGPARAGPAVAPTALEASKGSRRPRERSRACSPGGMVGWSGRWSPRNPEPKWGWRFGLAGVPSLRTLPYKEKGRPGAYTGGCWRVDRWGLAPRLGAPRIGGNQGFPRESRDRRATFFKSRWYAGWHGLPPHTQRGRGAAAS